MLSEFPPYLSANVCEQTLPRGRGSEKAAYRAATGRERCRVFASPESLVRCFRVLREQVLHLRDELVSFLLIHNAASRTWKARMDAFHQTIPAYEERSRPRIPIRRLRELVLGSARLAAKQYGVVDPILFDESLQSRGVL